jgi:hypothetical protein
MQNEQTESYHWVLDTFFSFHSEAKGISIICTDRDLALSAALEDICPENTHLLCIWHINKNVRGKAKKLFRTGEEVDKFCNSWHNVVYSKVEGEFVDKLQLLEREYGADSEAIQYISNTWLPWKEKSVLAWTKTHPHLGNSATSRVEGAHATIKKYIQTSTADILQVFEQLKLSIDKQVQALELERATDKTRTLTATRSPLYSALNNRTSVASIKLI